MILQRRELVRNDSGSGFIALDRNTLSLNREPFAHWKSDGHGSIAMYLWRSGKRAPRIEADLAEVRYFLENGIPDSVPLAQVTAPLLDLLEEGDYELVYPFVTAAQHGMSLIEYEEDAAGEPAHYYPTDMTFLTLQPEATLDRTRIDAFAAALDEGRRPILIAYGWAALSEKFLLDGHHKARAYLERRIDPQVLYIEKKKV